MNKSTILNFIKKNNKLIISIFIIIIIIILIIYFYYRENFISEGFTETKTLSFETGWNPTNATDYGEWTVPAGVKQATFTVIGGNSGDYSRPEAPPNYPFHTKGKIGYGANVTVTLSVNSGDTYKLFVGNNGNEITGGNLNLTNNTLTNVIEDALDFKASTLMHNYYC